MLQYVYGNFAPFQRCSIISSLPDVLLCALSYIFSEISTYIIFIFNLLPDITMEFFKKKYVNIFLNKLMVMHGNLLER